MAEIGGRRKSPGLQIEPLYYNPTDPSGGAFNSSLKHYRWFHGKWRPIQQNIGELSAAYLPRGMRSRSVDPFHPTFGFIPRNYPNANELQSNKPFHLGDTMAHQITNPIPVQILFQSSTIIWASKAIVTFIAAHLIVCMQQSIFQALSHHQASLDSHPL